MKQLLLFLSLVIAGNIMAQKNELDHSKVGCCKQHLFENKHPQKSFEREIPHPKMFDYDIKFTFLDIEVTNQSLAIEGQVRYDAVVTAESLDVFVLEAIDEINIEEITIADIPCSVSREGDFVLATLDGPLAEDEAFTAIVKYSRPATSSNGGFFTGISNSYNWNTYDKVTWTLSEPMNAEDWFPAKQILEDKSDSCYVYLTCSKETMAGSQGLLKEIVDLGDKHQFKWESKYPIAYYLISFAVSNYREYINYAYPEELGGDAITIQHYVYDDDTYFNNIKPSLDATPAMVELFSDKYSLYPFHEEKYGHTEAPLGGAMEHQTMSTMGSLDFGITAHELGHQWFGDNVTCATWNDIWVNEGFASYSEYIAIQSIKSQDQADSWMNTAMSAAQSADELSLYVPDEDVNNDNEYRIFDYNCTYKKGACILHMLRTDINDDEVFFNIFGTFQQEYKNSTATGDDFFEVASEVSGKDYTYFRDQWYYGKGYPKYEVEWSQDLESKKLFIQTTQTTTNSVTPFFQMTNVYKVTYVDNTTEYLYLEQTESIQDHMQVLDKEVMSLELNAELENLCWVKTIAVGVAETPAKEQFSIYPNPAKDQCAIQMMSETDIATVQVYDASGKMMMSDNFSGSTYNLNTSNLNKGVYIVNVKCNEYQFRNKLVIE